jgi:hypothetical protein
MSNRLRVGIEVPDQWLWRDRALYRREETAAAESLGTDSLRFTLVGRTRGSPVLGDQTLESGRLVSLDPDEDQPFLGIMGLSLDEVADQTLFDSQAGDMHVLGLQVIDPLSHRGPEAYRYRSGDTLQVQYPEVRSLISVEVHPREMETGSMTGQIWFDEGTHELVRMVVQPNGRWDVSSGLRGIARKIPLVSKNARGRVDYVSMDFARSPRGFALPQRAFVSAELLWFSNVMTMPTLIEWGVDWDPDTVSMVMDALDDLPDSAALALVPGPLSAGWDFGLPRHEINPFVRELARVVPNPPPPTGREMLLSSISSLRFDQVQGLSVAARYPYPVGPRETLRGELRVGTTSYRAIWEGAFRRDVRPVW